MSGAAICLVPLALLAVVACSPNEQEPSAGGDGKSATSTRGGGEAPSANASGGSTHQDASSARGDSGGSTSLGAAGGDGGAAGEASQSSQSTTDGTPVESGPLMLYYLDVTRDRVMSLNTAVGTVERLVEGAGRGPDGIAIDSEAGQLYWTNMGVPAENDGFILRAELDGSGVSRIIEPGETHTPKQIKLEQGQGKLYWGDREGMRVMRCNLDGSGLETLVTIAVGEAARADRQNHAVGVSVDAERGYLYWVQKGGPNAGEGSIRRAALLMPAGENSQNRTDVEVLFDGLPEPIDLELDAGANMLYWTDRGDGTINRAPVAIPEGANARTRRDRQVLVRGVDVAIGIWLDLEARHVYYTGTDVVGRVDLDGGNHTRLLNDAGVLTGITGARLVLP